MNQGVSVIICCYNSATRLPETLRHIANQITSVNYEVIVVDNSSMDNTGDIAVEEWGKLSKSVVLNLVTETTPGLSAARAKGIATAKFEYLIFCDDDNWLAPNYVSDVYEMFEKDSTIGIIGGNGSPVTDSQLPFWFEKFIHGYAAFPQSDKSQFVSGVYGAGMATRKTCFYVISDNNFESLLSDRKGETLSSGGDSELCYQFRLAGFKIWYDERLRFQHFIPAKRLNWEYLKKLHIGFAKSNVVLNLYDYALNTNGKSLPNFYWLKKAGYYFGIYVKYWPKQYSVYKNGIGSMEEINHITWKVIGFEYLKHNLKIKNYYKIICSLSLSINQ